MASPEQFALVLWLLVLQRAGAEAYSRTLISSSNPQSFPIKLNHKAHSRSLLTEACGGGDAAKPRRPFSSASQGSLDITADGSNTNASTGVGPESVLTSSVCPQDKPFTLTRPSNTTCRLVARNHQDKSFLCTAWFISPNHVATAGHCAARQGAYILNRYNPGYMCCSFSRNGNCKPQYTWRLLQWVTTTGYYAGVTTANDGAVVEVAPANPDDFVPGVVQNLTTFYPTAVPAHIMYMDGYPGINTYDNGCGNVIPTRRYQTYGRVRPTSDGSGVNAGPVSYSGVAGCGGESGGRVLLGGKTGLAYGIQTFGAVGCNQGYGLTGVTQVTLTPEPCGVCLPCLMRALIKVSASNDTASNSTSATG